MSTAVNGQKVARSFAQTGRQQLLLGWTGGNRLDSYGLPPGPALADDGRRAVTYDGDGPLITAGPTGSGKGRGVIIPNLGIWPGSAFVNDIKGELFHVTARARRQMGQHVALLDPFGKVIGGKSDGLNVLELMSLPGSDLESDAQMVASLLSVQQGIETEPYWNIAATSLIAGLIAHIGTYPPQERHLGHLRRWLYHDDLDISIAKLLDSNQVQSRMARDQLIAYLAAPPERTRPCIRSMACSFISALCSEDVERCLRLSSFGLKDVYDGRPLTIYIVIPPDKLESHKSLLRLWVGTLLTTVMRRQIMPRHRTLFLLDEVAQLGELPMLRQAVTLLRGSGLQAWLFLQDLSQLRHLYPNDWRAMVNNAGVLQTFGINNYQMAKEWGELLGEAPETLDKLAPEDTAVRRQGQGRMVCRRPDYLTDPMFAGLFDENPRFALQP